ncbi:hypothetical protein SCLCIDRAFT_18269 [Scleroderma citrinum Foug A]|uniref:PX domain-containing protein n=1 Tax=Scleroderma citrinum Foug A TaxID=1036808 RepID=A0A0C3CU98_9AGAM|nr:hypothetical protein SCLCIDRAFT_18269 [Scleroderma citrinum Foug A]
MFDPLSSTVLIFANGESNSAPPWLTTLHKPNSPIPNLRYGPYGREPRIYGQPEPGLISSQTTTSSNGIKFEKKEPYLQVWITGMDCNRRDILVKFDAQTNLSNFMGTAYHNVSRSYYEFQQFYEALLNSCLHTIIPALPLAQTSALMDEEDDCLMRIMLQQWLTRICEDPIVMHDKDLRLFIDSDFGYQPILHPRVPDEDEVLQHTHFELMKLETQFFNAAKAIDKLTIT